MWPSILNSCCLYRHKRMLYCHNSQRLVCLIAASSLIIHLFAGCLYTYHDYKFSPNPAKTHGYWIHIQARLFHQVEQSNKPVDGKIADTVGSYWSIAWYGNVDDSLRPIAHLESDSVSIWIPKCVDTLYCNMRQDMTGGQWNKWKCGRITYQQLNSRDITLRMVVYMIFTDGRETRRFEVIWSGKQKTTRIHSDY